MKPSIFGIICLLFSFVKLSIAGITGTLSGHIIDNDTQTPLEGVNVVLVGTDLGTISDETGYFVLNNIPGGTYAVRFMRIGYTTKTIKGVVILMDQHKKIDVHLQATALDVGAEVTVHAQRQLLQQDVTATMHITTGEEINFMPVKDFQDAIKREPGVVGRHVRGGRETEVLYLVDGIPIQEAIYGETGANLPNSSIIEMSLQTGGFNAEYGNAMSGVVNVVTKEGTAKTQGLFKYYTDYIGGDQSDHLNQFELNLGGGLWGEKNNYFLSADFATSDTRWRTQFDGKIDAPNLIRYNINGKAVTYFHPRHKLVWQGIISHQTWTDYEHPWKRHLEGLPEHENNSYRYSLTYTHTLSSKTFYKTSLSRFYVLNQILGKNNGVYEMEDYILVSEPPHSIRYFVDKRDPTDPDPLVKPQWRDSEQIITIGKADFTSQLNPFNQLKLGAEFTHYDLYVNNVEYVLIDPDAILPGYPPEAAYSVYVTKYDYQPVAGAAYLQFKTEALQEVTLNYGVRFDFLDPKTHRPAVEFDFEQGRNPFRPQEIINDKTVRAEFQYQISPRFGVSMPITEIDMINFNYGHFFQFPLFSYLYTNPTYDFKGYNSLLGNPDLAAEKTVAYEVGWEHLLTEDIKFSANYFNKDIENLIDKVTFYLYDAELNATKPFEQYRNLSFGSSYGLEFYLEKRRGVEAWSGWLAHLSGKISYTWMHAKGSSSQFGTQYDPEGVITVPPHEYYLSWDQRHTLVANVDYRLPENWGINVLLRVNSGQPYTPADPDPFDTETPDPNSKRMESTTYFDFKLNKDMTFGWLFASCFLEVLNAFDADNVIWVDHNGQPGGVYADPTAWDVGRRINLGILGKF
ncbi:MAG: TonB-dependent receptor [Gemmatimonadetes bacterium]|nr:MAG: TonB-dependent receptor [Gemmatimonadota bacterium]